MTDCVKQRESYIKNISNKYIYLIFQFTQARWHVTFSKGLRCLRQQAKAVSKNRKEVEFLRHFTQNHKCEPHGCMREVGLRSWIIAKFLKRCLGNLEVLELPHLGQQLTLQLLFKQRNMASVKGRWGLRSAGDSVKCQQ